MAAGVINLQELSREKFDEKCKAADDADIDRLLQSSGFAKNGTSAWAGMWPSIAQDKCCPGRLHMFAITIKADLEVILGLPHMAAAVAAGMRSHKSANTARCSPSTAKLLTGSATSTENLIGYLCFPACSFVS